MDNKITRRRLHNFLAYEWIVMLVVVVVGILAWELIFTMTRIMPTTGQDFLFFYDQTIDSASSGQVYALLEHKDKPERTIFSYDLLKISHEVLSEEYNVLEDRLTIQEGDLIITDMKAPEQDAEDQSVRAKSIIDTFLTYDYISLKDDAEEYLSKLLKYHLVDDYEKGLVDVTNYDLLDESKIEELFRDRMSGDNRYRSESEISQGIELEKERIQDLCLEVKKFRYLLEQGDEYFMMYRRYDQAYEQGVKDEIKEVYEKDEYRLKGVRPYGLKLEKLTGGTEKNPASRYFRMKGADNAKDVVILVFDLKEYQPHLQFESIAFINAIVDNCSDLYEDGNYLN